MRTLLEAVREGDPGVIVGPALMGLALVGGVWVRWARRPVKPRNQAYTVASIQARLEREQATFQAQIDQARRAEFQRRPGSPTIRSCGGPGVDWSSASPKGTGAVPAPVRSGWTPDRLAAAWPGHPISRGS